MLALLVATAALADTGDVPPVADAGKGLYAYVGDTVQLNGTGSEDPEGAELTFAWSQVSGPPVELDRDDAPKPSFVVTDVGAMEFELVVHDGAQDSEPSRVVVVVPSRSASPTGVADDAGCATRPGTGATVSLLAALVALRFARRR